MTKPLAALAALLLLTPVLPAQAQRQSQGGFATERTCYKNVYREEYTPGTRGNPGSVRSWTEREETLCNPEGPHSPQPYNPRPQSSSVDDNSCIEGSIIGGIAGGAAGGTLATESNWIWSIPAGVIGGALVGCQVDGG